MFVLPYTCGNVYQTILAANQPSKKGHVDVVLDERNGVNARDVFLLKCQPLQLFVSDHGGAH